MSSSTNDKTSTLNPIKEEEYETDDTYCLDKLYVQNIIDAVSKSDNKHSQHASRVTSSTDTNQVKQQIEDFSNSYLFRNDSNE